jgi:hypothetical protein
MALKVKAGYTNKKYWNVMIGILCPLIYFATESTDIHQN